MLARRSIAAAIQTGRLAQAFGGTNVTDQRAAVVLYAMIALLVSAKRALLFVHWRRQAVTLISATAPNYFAGEVIRPSARLLDAEGVQADVLVAADGQDLPGSWQ